MSTSALDHHVSTGIPGLDQLVGGGFPLHRAVLVSGDLGTGKTTFGLHFIMEGARCGEAGILVAIDQKPQHVLDDARRLGLDVDKAHDEQLLIVLGSSPCFTTLRGKNGLDSRRMASDLTQQIRRIKATRLVIDAATSLVPDGGPAAEVEDFLRSLILSFEDNLECTTVLTARTTLSAHTGPVGPNAERFASGVIRLSLGTLSPGSQGGRWGRSLQVRKMRGGPIDPAPHSFDIVEGRGIVLQ